MRVTATGAVGIGTTVPTTRFHVVSSDYQTLRCESNAGNADGTYIEMYANSASPADNDYLGLISFKGNDDGGTETTYAQIRSRADDVSNGSESGHISFHTRNAGTFGEGLRITAAGRVLIGDSAATSLLSVGGSNLNWDVGDVPMLLIEGYNNEAPGSGSHNIAFQIVDENSNLIHKVWNAGGGNADKGYAYYGGRVLINTTTSTEVWGYGQASLQVMGDYQTAGASFIHNGNNTNSHAITLAKTRNGSIVQENDTCGALVWSADDGNGYSPCARILAQVDGTPGDGDMPGRMMFYTTPNSNATLIERLRITNAGNILTNANTSLPTGSTQGFGFSTDQFYLSYTGTGANYSQRFYNGNGLVGSVLVSGSATAFNTSSDYRLKENEVSILDGIIRLKSLKPYRFNFKSDPTKTLDGFFAHEVQEVVPGAASGTKDEVELEDNEETGAKAGDIIPQSVDHSKLVPLLTAALQEAIAKIETLETKVAALESK